MTNTEALIEYNRLLDKYYKAQLIFEIEQDRDMKQHINDTLVIIFNRLLELERQVYNSDDTDYELALDIFEEIERD